MNAQTGNQQPKVSDIDIGWLCGLIDGEGTLTLRWNTMRQKKYLTPFLQIANGDIATLNKCVEILSALGVGHNVRWIDPAASRLTKRMYWTILVVGMKRLERLLPTIMPYLVTKQRQGFLVWEFLQERFSKNQQAPYGETERRILMNLHAITDKGKKPRTETWLNDRMPDMG